VPPERIAAEYEARRALLAEALPPDGLGQLFARDDGGEPARHMPAGDLERLEPRERIPISGRSQLDRPQSRGGDRRRG
jgi:hypothetical protein